MLGCNAAESFRRGNQDAVPSADTSGPGGGSIDEGTGGGTGGGPFGLGGGTGGEPFGSGGAGGSGTGGAGTGGGAAGSGGAPSSMDASTGDASADTGGNAGSSDAANDRGGTGGLVNDGLVGYWKLDEGKSPIADSSGNGISGTLFNSPTWTAGPALKFPNASAMVLNGTNQYASLGNPGVLNFSGPITMAAWIKASATDGARNILAHGYDASNEVFLRIASGYYEVGSWVNPTSLFTNYAIPGGDVGTWVHLAGVYDGTTWRLYRNGVQVGSSVQAVGAVTVTTNWCIGARGDGTSRWFAGSIDDVRIYKRALSAAEIADLYR